MPDTKPPYLTATSWFLLLAMCLGLPACDREPIRTYRAPHEDNTLPPTLAGAGTPSAQTPSVSSPDAEVAYEFTQPLPPGWQRETQARSMVLGAYQITQNNQSALLTVTSFPGDVGGNLANVNRWRRQLGLEPLANEGDARLAAITVAGQPGWLFDATHDQSRMLVAFTLIDGRSWFFKLMGPTELLEGQKAALLNMVATVRLHASPTPTAREMPRG